MTLKKSDESKLVDVKDILIALELALSVQSNKELLVSHIKYVDSLFCKFTDDYGTDMGSYLIDYINEHKDKR